MEIINFHSPHCFDFYKNENINQTKNNQELKQYLFQ